jgi:hypothetical protein
MARRGLDSRDHGTVDALHWVTIGDVAPVGQRAVDATWERVRAKSWLALCLAAGQELPTERDRQRLGVEAYPAVHTDPAYCYGAWRTLAWLLGVREDWPVHTAWHQAAEIPRNGPMPPCRVNSGTRTHGELLRRPLPSGTGRTRCCTGSTFAGGPTPLHSA